MKLSGEHLFARFKTMYPSVADRSVDWERCSQFEISVVLDDNTTVFYDDVHKTIKSLKPNAHDLSEDDFRFEFAKRLADKLERSGMTQRDLSDATGISRQSIAKYLNGSVLPTIPKLFTLAVALGCPTIELIEYDTTPYTR